MKTYSWDDLRDEFDQYLSDNSASGLLWLNDFFVDCNWMEVLGDRLYMSRFDSYVKERFDIKEDDYGYIITRVT